MKISFSKYHGAGNDFVLIDNRNGILTPENFDTKRINCICHRRFGVGADGLMLLNSHITSDFAMRYYNCDGNESTMCGNGGRCITLFAKYLGIINKKANFTAIDGEHQSEIISSDEESKIRLKMISVSEIEIGHDFYYLNTGSPHYVVFRENISDFDVFKNGRDIRYNERFFTEGTNVDFVEIQNDSIFVRTYERGVEDETLACGTGVVASAIANYLRQSIDKQNFTTNIKALGGNLSVDFEKKNNIFTNIWLQGPAKLVFTGEIEME